MADVALAAATLNTGILEKIEATALFGKKTSMTSFTAGLTIGDKKFPIFSIAPYCDVTPFGAVEIGEAMEYLRDKVNQDPENLYEVFVIHKRLFDDFGPLTHVELEKPAQVGVKYIIDAIRAANVKVKTYYREEKL
jgi:hypothetical protein